MLNTKPFAFQHERRAITALFHSDMEGEMPKGGRLRVVGEKGRLQGPPRRPVKEEERGMRFLC